MSELNIKLVQSKIVNMDAYIGIENCAAVSIEASFSAEMFEPKDSGDPTVMLKVKCELNDTQKKLLHIACTNEMVFEIDPIPESYAEAINQYSTKRIQKDVMQKIAEVTSAMGHNFVIS